MALVDLAYRAATAISGRTIRRMWTARTLVSLRRVRALLVSAASSQRDRLTVYVLLPMGEARMDCTIDGKLSLDLRQ